MSRQAFRIRHRAPSLAKEVPLTTTEQNRIGEILVPFFIQIKGMDEVTAKTEAIAVITEAQKGWPRAPKDIYLRLQKKSGYKFLEDRPLQATSVKPKNGGKVLYRTVRESLDDQEKLWWDSRIKLYVEEFEFNKSSDIALLEQVVVEELLQKRLSIEQLTQGHIDSMMSKTQSESTKRMLDMQEKLGITRKQREESMSNIDGNIASVAVLLEEKLAMIQAEAKKQKEEEDYFQAQKDAEPPINVLPSEEKLLTMIGDLSLLPTPVYPILAEATQAKITPIKKDGTS